MENLRNLHYFAIGQIFILSAVFSGCLYAQEVPVASPAPPAKVSLQISTSGQSIQVSKQFPSAVAVKTDNAKAINKPFTGYDDIPVEKSISVDKDVNLSFCVSEGRVKVNGWNRNEVRVFVTDGGDIGFRDFGKNRDGKPTRITVLGYDPVKSKGSVGRECLSGEEIELDVPYGTNLSRLEAERRRRYNRFFDQQSFY